VYNELPQAVKKKYPLKYFQELMEQRLVPFMWILLPEDDDDNETWSKITIGPRAMLELRNYIEQINDKACAVCNHKVLWRTICDGCGAHYHASCLEKWHVRNNTCVKCKDEWSLRVPEPPSRRQKTPRAPRSTRRRSDVADKDEEENDDDEEDNEEVEPADKVKDEEVEEEEEEEEEEESLPKKRKRR
jgi:hypothetical protein